MDAADRVREPVLDGAFVDYAWGIMAACGSFSEAAGASRGITVLGLASRTEISS